MRTLLIICIWVLALGRGALLAAERGSDDWGALLSGADEVSVADTGIVGMSAEELEAYAEAEDEGEADEEIPEDFIRQRRCFVVREIRFNTDWDCDPTALPAMVAQYKRRTGYEALALQPREPLTFDDPELVHWPFIYMTAHNAFTLNDEEVRGLRDYLFKGGFLYADDCLYGFPFGCAFPGEVSRVLPEAKWTPLAPDHPIFGMVLKQKYSWPTTNEAGLPMQFKPNFFHYSEINGHIAILLTPNDIGCAWEISTPPTPANPLGGAMHNLDRIPGRREATYRIGVNIFLYAMLH